MAERCGAANQYEAGSGVPPAPITTATQPMKRAQPTMTPRLRPFGNDDLAAIIVQLGDPRVAEWLAAIRQPFDISQAEEFLAFSADPAQRVFALDQDGVVIGGLCLGDALWYWLAPSHWGHGYMARALRAALADHFAVPTPPLTATCREDNTASLSVLRRVGFSAAPMTRRMFFHGAGTSYLCRDHMMTPEQWHVLNPPHLQGPRISLRPARQADLASVQRLLQGQPRCDKWPGQDETKVRHFLETHRFRGAGTALWIIENEERCVLGMVLCDGGRPALRFSTAKDRDRLLSEVHTLLDLPC